uniref:TNF superfamily member 12 n=1 Tax=Podarcis muralis TaxID=64176 RepID=A0A670J0I9_PODMU
MRTALPFECLPGLEATQESCVKENKRLATHLGSGGWTCNNLFPVARILEDGFATEIWWEPFLQQGRALELSGRDVVVRHMGLYFVYSQVLFRDPTFTMGQVLWRKAHGKPGQILFRCVQSMPPNPEKAFNSCYSGGVFHLQPGDRLNLRIPRFNASFDLTAHGTFLGFLRL